MGFKPDYLGGWRWEDGGTTAVPYTWSDSRTSIQYRGWSHMLPDDYTIPPAKGWVCPLCGRANAPWVVTCPCYESGTIKHTNTKSI